MQEKVGNEIKKREGKRLYDNLCGKPRICAQRLKLCLYIELKLKQDDVLMALM